MQLAPRNCCRAKRLRATGLALLLVAVATTSCSSLSVRRDTQSSGTFHATGWAFTFLSWDVPRSALDIARENASDARLPRAVVEHTSVMPYLGWFDWVLDIVGVRRASVSGRWGFTGDDVDAATQ